MGDPSARLALGAVPGSARTGSPLHVHELLCTCRGSSARLALGAIRAGSELCVPGLALYVQEAFCTFRSFSIRAEGHLHVKGGLKITWLADGIWHLEADFDVRLGQKISNGPKISNSSFQHAPLLLPLGFSNSMAVTLQKLLPMA